MYRFSCNGCYIHLCVSCPPTYLILAPLFVPCFVSYSSPPLSAAVSTIIFVSIAGLPIIMALPLDPYLKDLVVGFCFFIGLCVSSGFYFGPKVYLLLNGADLNAQFQLVMKKNSKRMDQNQMAETLRNEVAAEDANAVADQATREEFKKEVPKNVTMQYARTRLALWKETIAQLELKATIETGSSGGAKTSSGGAGTGAVGGGYSTTNSIHHVSVNHSVDMTVRHEKSSIMENNPLPPSKSVRRPYSSRQSSEGDAAVGGGGHAGGHHNFHEVTQERVL